MKEIENAAILGAGAMGAVYASKFFDAPGLTVHLIAREPRYGRLKEQGVIVNGKQYFVPVIHPDEALPATDLILVALKHHHLPEAIQDLKNLVGDDTTFISVMNGLDSEEYIGSIYGMGKVLYAVALGMDAVREGNSVRFTNPGRILFGNPENAHPSQRVLSVRAAFDRAGIASEVPVDMMRMLWWKFMVNVGVNQASAVIRGNYGVFQTSPDAEALAEALMREVILLAQAAGVNLSERDLDGWPPVLNSLSPEGKTSMLQDMEAGRKTEVEMFAGKVVELGARFGVPTPVNQTILNIIRVLEEYRT